MKNKYKKIIILFLSLIFCLSSVIAFADTSNSNGNPNGDFGGGSTGGTWGIGPNFGQGLSWNHFSGTKTLVSDLPGVVQTDGYSSIAINDATKGSYVGLHSKQANKTTWLRWGWWYRYLKDPSNYSNKGYYDGKTVWHGYGYDSNYKGQLTDGELVKEAAKDGYYYNGSKQVYENANGRKLDAVWITKREERTTDTRHSLYTASVTNNGQKKDLLNRSNESAESIFKNPTTQIPYSFTSQEGVLENETKVNGNYVTITQNAVYDVYSDGRRELKSANYSKSGVMNLTEHNMSYKAQKPEIWERLLKPFDLNTNKPIKYDRTFANNNEQLTDISSATNSLDISVDNLQGITDGREIKNEKGKPTQFNITFNNNSLGIKEDLTTTTTKNLLNIDRISKNLNTQTNYTSYKNYKLEASVTGDATINGSKHPVISTNAGTKNITFKSESPGLFKLSSDGLDGEIIEPFIQDVWWIGTYEKSKSFKYGIKYDGNINLNTGISSPIYQELNYNGLNSVRFKQPIVKGKFRTLNTETIETIYKAEIQGDGDPKILIDQSKKTAKEMFENPIKELPYNGKSKIEESFHNRKVVAYKVKITKTPLMTSNDFDYSIDGGVTFIGSKNIEYQVIRPKKEELLFKPFDLNKNGPVKIDSEFLRKNQFLNITNDSKALDMSVDNLQNINDGSKIQTLDLNTPTPFNVKFNNDQFGIPLKKDGGIDIVNTKLTFNGGLMNVENSNLVYSKYGNGTLNLTGTFSVDGTKKSDIKTKTSLDFYSDCKLISGIDNIRGTSLTFNRSELLAGNPFIFDYGFKGGQFSFRSTKTGLYNLNSEGFVDKNKDAWWSVSYGQSKFYEYGVAYNGMITLFQVGDPNLNNTSLYIGPFSNSIVQPILKGSFEVKTVGGNIG